MKGFEIIKEEVASVEYLGDYDDEYVYDIGIKGNTPFFFANNILVHNSCYFSVVPVMDKMEKAPSTTKEDYIELYDYIGDQVNASFPEFMNDKFNTGIERGKIIACGREIVASSALFIKKKKYAALAYDIEGHRKDVDGSDGELKVIGLDLKRADTPQYMQEFLEKVLMMTLREEDKDDIFGEIREFRELFRDKPGWDKGTPKKVNSLTDNTEKLEDFENVNDILKSTKSKKKARISGHIMASINWNRMLDERHDLETMRISDGSKIIVCKLKKNIYGMTSIAYPIDVPTIPDWFKELPFQDRDMEKAIINFKLENLLGVLEWDLTLTDNDVVNDFLVW